MTTIGLSKTASVISFFNMIDTELPERTFTNLSIPELYNVAYLD